jgi:phosphatidylglycerophosphate synthase
MASGSAHTLDGILARTYKQQAPSEAFRFSSGQVLGLVCVCRHHNQRCRNNHNAQFILIAGLAALASSFMVSYSRARAEAVGIKMESIGLQKDHNAS